MTEQTQNSRLREAILETAGDLRRLGIIDGTTHDKITLRQVVRGSRTGPLPITPGEIRKLREEARLSQAVFAQLLNLTVGYVSQMERGVKQPSGPALVLLDLMRRKGVEAVL